LNDCIRYDIEVTFLTVADCCNDVVGCSRGLCWNCLCRNVCNFRIQRTLPEVRVRSCKNCEFDLEILTPRGKTKRKPRPNLHISKPKKKKKKRRKRK